MRSGQGAEMAMAINFQPELRLPVVPAALSRRFVALLGLSLLFHAVLFGLISWQRKSVPPVLPTIIAVLRPASTPESGASAVVQASPAAALPPKARPEPVRPLEKGSGRNIAPAVPATVATSAASSEATYSPPAAVAAPNEALASREVATPPAKPQSEVLDAYRRRLGELLARQQEYPRVAALRGWEGEVRLRLKVARKGNLLGVQVDRSSGFEVLDQHALAMLEALAGLPPLPEALEANEIQVVVPINYKLKKTT